MKFTTVIALAGATAVLAAPTPPAAEVAKRDDYPQTYHEYGDYPETYHEYKDYPETYHEYHDYPETYHEYGHYRRAVNWVKSWFQ
ncbi:hypothetical protein MN608_06499 [Microdochium nivale]|nr:hypothetical protein MN608_06499 [Microdochium nivale]